MKSVNLYEAKTQLSSLVEEAAEGERIVISKSGVPRAMLVPLPKKAHKRKPAGALRISYIADDFDDPDADVATMLGEDGGSRS